MYGGLEGLELDDNVMRSIRTVMLCISEAQRNETNKYIEETYSAPTQYYSVLN